MMKRSVVVLAALVALSFWQGANVAWSSSADTDGGLITLESARPGSDRPELGPAIDSAPEELDMVDGAREQAPVMVKQ